MRKLMLGMLLAAGAALPTMAMANMARQDRPQEDHPQGTGEHRQHGGGERPQNGNGRQGQPRPAPQPAPAAPAPQPRPQAAPVPPQAQAQTQGRVETRGNGAQFQGNGDARFSGGNQYRGPRDARPDTGQPYRGFNGDPNHGAPQPGYRPQGGPGGYAPQDDGRRYRPGPGNPGPARANGGNWNRGWRDDHRYDWGRYRAQNRGAFHLPRYYAPQGWQYGYRRFSPGFTLSFGLFDRSYWIDDAYYYRLPPAYWPYQWVRYYNDALLVDVRTGYVVDTVYDIFW